MASFLLPVRPMPGADFDDDLRELREDYLATLNETIETLEMHAKGLSESTRVKTSFPVLLYLTHQIKGTAGTLGFPGISEIARDLATNLEDFLSKEKPTVSREEISTSALEAVEKLKAAIAKD